MMRMRAMRTYGVSCDPELWELMREEADRRMVPMTELARIAIGRWLVNQRRLRAEQLNADGRLIPEDHPRKAKRRRAKPADEGNVTALYDDAGDAAE